MKVNNTSHRNRLNKTIFQDPNILFSHKKSHKKKQNEITRFNRVNINVSFNNKHFEKCKDTRIK